MRRLRPRAARRPRARLRDHEGELRRLLVGGGGEADFLVARMERVARNPGFPHFAPLHAGYELRVIASEAKQSRATRVALDCVVALRAPRNDDGA